MLNCVNRFFFFSFRFWSRKINSGPKIKLLSRKSCGILPHIWALWGLYGCITLKTFRGQSRLIRRQFHICTKWSWTCSGFIPNSQKLCYRIQIKPFTMLQIAKEVFQNQRCKDIPNTLFQFSKLRPNFQNLSPEVWSKMAPSFEKTLLRNKCVWFCLYLQICTCRNIYVRQYTWHW